MQRLDRLAVEIDRITDAAVARAVGAQIKEADLVIHQRYFRASAQADKHHYDILLLRPFQTYTMHSAIMAKGGSDLGNVYHGHHDFQLSDNVAVKTHFGNYTFYSKAVVKRPRNYTIIPDCFAQGYISGEGHDFFMPPADRNDAGELGQAIQEGSLGSSDCRKSLIAWKIPRGDGEKLADAIDITGALLARTATTSQTMPCTSRVPMHLPLSSSLKSLTRTGQTTPTCIRCSR